MPTLSQIYTFLVCYFHGTLSRVLALFLRRDADLEEGLKTPGKSSSPL
jgi:hypothetical protein